MEEQFVTKTVTAVICYWDELDYEEFLRRYMDGERLPEYLIAIHKNQKILGIAKVVDILVSARNTVEMLAVFLSSQVHIADEEEDGLSKYPFEKIFDIKLCVKVHQAPIEKIKKAYDEIYRVLMKAKLNVVRVAIPEKANVKHYGIEMAYSGFYGIVGHKIIQKVYDHSFEYAKQKYMVQKCEPWFSYIDQKETDRRIFLVGPCIANAGMNLKSDSLPAMLQRKMEQLGYVVNIVCISVYRHTLDEIYRLLEYALSDHDLIFLIESDDVFDKCEINVGDAFKRYQGDKWLYYNDNPFHATIYGQKIIIDEMLKTSINPWMDQNNNIKNESVLYGRDLLECRNKKIQKEYSNKIDQYIQMVKKLCINIENGCGAIVMNANPFTNGHRYLVENALSQVRQLILFVVEEDCSYVPFADRFRLVEQGVADLKNVVVVPSGNYIISSTTFQSYFEKETKTEAVIDAAKDIDIFGKQIAPALGIVKRFVGEEPKDFITKQYNEQMKLRLPRYGIELVEIPRAKEDTIGDVISASTVRASLKDGKYDLIGKMVPVSTLNYLKSNYERLERRKKCEHLIKQARKEKGRQIDAISNLKQVVEIIGQNKMTVIYGTGIDALMVLRELPTEYLDRIRFCDKKALQINYEFMGKTVYSPESIDKEEKVIIASREYQIEMFTVLYEMGIPIENIIFLKTD